MAKLGDLFPNELQPKRPAARPGAPVVNPAPAGTRAFIADLAAGQEIEGVYLVGDATLRVAKNGSKYVQATFCDKSGSIPVRHWDATEADFAFYKAGAYIKARGRVETYKNAMQMIAFAVKDCAGETINAADFLAVSSRPLPEMEAELDALVASLTDPDYRRLLAGLFENQALRRRFVQSPAASSIHHAWVGGLLEHVLSASRTAQALAQQWPALNRDLLLSGVLLHDLGKIEELDPGPGFGYTDTGRLCGHIALGALLIDRQIAQLKDFPPRKRDLILHMILSHHGTREFGSPVTPVTAEAVALHYVECLDAKIQGIQTLVEKERHHTEGNWTEFARIVEGRIYKG